MIGATREYSTEECFRSPEREGGGWLPLFYLLPKYFVENDSNGVLEKLLCMVCAAWKVFNWCQASLECTSAP